MVNRVAAGNARYTANGTQALGGTYAPSVSGTPTGNLAAPTTAEGWAEDFQEAREANLRHRLTLAIGQARAEEILAECKATTDKYGLERVPPQFNTVGLDDDIVTLVNEAFIARNYPHSDRVDRQTLARAAQAGFDTVEAYDAEDGAFTCTHPNIDGNFRVMTDENGLLVQRLSAWRAARNVLTETHLESVDEAREHLEALALEEADERTARMALERARSFPKITGLSDASYKYAPDGGTFWINGKSVHVNRDRRTVDGGGEFGPDFDSLLVRADAQAVNDRCVALMRATDRGLGVRTRNDAIRVVDALYESGTHLGSIRFGVEDHLTAKPRVAALLKVRGSVLRASVDEFGDVRISRDGEVRPRSEWTRKDQDVAAWVEANARDFGELNEAVYAGLI